MTSQDAPTRLRWFQFRLRTLFIVMTLAAFPMAWLGFEYRQRQREKPAIAWIEKMEGSVEFSDGWLDEWMGKTAKKVFLNNAPVSDLSPLAGLKNLEQLYLNDTPVSDLSPLAGLKSLELLALTNAPVSDEQVKKIQESLPNLWVFR